jgi:hypothetical protein
MIVFLFLFLFAEKLTYSLPSLFLIFISKQDLIVEWLTLPQKGNPYHRKYAAMVLLGFLINDKKWEQCISLVKLSLANNDYAPMNRLLSAAWERKEKEAIKMVWHL